MEAASPVFKDIFELGKALVEGAELPEVQLDETSAILEVSLPYLYPKRVEPFRLDFPRTWEVIKLFDKYEVSGLGVNHDRRVGAHAFMGRFTEAWRRSRLP